MQIPEERYFNNYNPSIQNNKIFKKAVHILEIPWIQLKKSFNKANKSSKSKSKVKVLLP